MLVVAGEVVRRQSRLVGPRAAVAPESAHGSPGDAAAHACAHHHVEGRAHQQGVSFPRQAGPETVADGAIAGGERKQPGVEPAERGARDASARHGGVRSRAASSRARTCSRYGTSSRGGFGAGAPAPTCAQATMARSSKPQRWPCGVGSRFTAA